MIIGICGPSASGKSTLAEMLADEFGGKVIKLDNYFLPNPIYKKYDDDGKNWELPENVDWPAVEKLVDEIASGKDSVTVRKFIFDDNTYTESEQKVKPMMIIEGFLLLHDDEILKKMDLTVYLDIPDRVGLKRRMQRDGSDENRAWYEEVTFPEYAPHRDHFERKADVVLDGELSINDNFAVLKEKIKGLM